MRILIVLVVVALLGYFGFMLWRPPSTTDQPLSVSSQARVAANSPGLTPLGTPRERPAQVAGLGRLEPTGGAIDVGGMTGDRVVALLVREGERVEAGQELARLESFTLREAELKATQLTLADARRRQPIETNYGQALVQVAKAGVAQADLLARDRTLLESKLSLAKAALDVAEHDLKRLEGISEPIVSRQDREHQQLKVRQAQAEIGATQAELDKLDASAKVARTTADAKLAEADAGGARLQAALQLDVLEQNVHLAGERLKMSQVRAPISGQVLKVFTRTGETITQRPVLRVGDIAQMSAVCEIYETQVWAVAVGQPALVTSRALEKPLHGRVSFVGHMVSRNEVMSVDPTKASDNRVVEVRIDIEEDTEAAKLINLQIEVVIETKLL